MKTYYHESFLRTCWSAFFSFYIVFLSFCAITSILLEHSIKELAYLKFVIPCFICVILGMDMVIQLYPHTVEYVLLVYLFLFGISI